MILQRIKRIHTIISTLFLYVRWVPFKQLQSYDFLETDFQMIQFIEKSQIFH